MIRVSCMRMLRATRFDSYPISSMTSRTRLAVAADTP